MNLSFTYTHDLSQRYSQHLCLSIHPCKQTGVGANSLDWIPRFSDQIHVLKNDYSIN